MVNTVTNKVARLLGKDETVRWMNLTIYQGQPSKKSLNTLVNSMASLRAFRTHSVSRRLWRLPPILCWPRRR